MDRFIRFKGNSLQNNGLQSYPRCCKNRHPAEDAPQKSYPQGLLLGLSRKESRLQQRVLRLAMPFRSVILSLPFLRDMSFKQQKPVSASTLKLAVVYGGLAVAMINPIVGVASAAGLYQLYKLRKKVEDEERELQRQVEQEAFKAKFYRRQNFASYEDYLLSPQWAEKRDLVAQRSHCRCESEGCKNALDEVHHLRYPRVWGNEPIGWLIGLCEPHHHAAHAKQSAASRSAPTPQDAFTSPQMNPDQDRAA